MDYSHLIEQYFKSEFKEVYTSRLDEIIDHISNKYDSFVLSQKGITHEQLMRRNADDNYKLQNEIILTEEGLHVDYAFKDFWKDIIRYIPRSVKYLSIPFKVIENNIQFLGEFPLLEKLELTDNTKLRDVHLKFISEQTPIKKIKGMFQATQKYSKNYATSNNILVYDGIVIENGEDKLTTRPFITCNSLDKNILEKLYENLINKFHKKIVIYVNENKYTITIDENKNLNVYIESNNLEDIIKFYDYLSNNEYKVKEINFSTNDLDIDNLDYSMLNRLREKVVIKFISNSKEITFDGL